MKPKFQTLRSVLLPTRIALCLGLGIAGLAPVEAATLTWDASGLATSAPTDGAGTWDTAAVNWNDGTVTTAWPDTNADIAVFGAANGAAGTVTVNTVTANGITFYAPGSGNYELSSGTITLDGTTPTITSKTNATISSVIAGTAGLRTTGSPSATLTLTGTNTYTGTTEVNAGTLNLGGGTANGSIDSTSPLSMGGGTLTLTRTGGITQTFNGTTIAEGASLLRNTVAGNTLALGALSQTPGNGGTVDFTTTGTVSASATLSNGIIGGWATTGNSGVASTAGDWATISGGNIATYTGYTDVSGTTIAPAATANWRTGVGGQANLSASGTINTLLMRGDFNIANGQTLTLGGGGLIMQGVARWLKNNNNTTNGWVGTGKITSGLASGELFLHVPKSDATNWTIWTTIADNGVTPVKLIKDGPGLVYLENNNTFTGGTTVNGGTLRIEHAVGNVGAGVLRGTLTINPAGTVVASGANANTLGYTAGQSVNVMNVNGGLFSSIVAGDQGYAITYNLNGGTIQSNGGVSSNAATQYLVFGGSSVVNVLASDTTSTLAGRASLRDNNTNFNVSDGAAATDLLASAALTGGFGFTKTGPGHMVLSGANLHTGTTNVSGGKITLTGSIAGSSLSVGNISGTPAAMYQAGNVTTGGAGLRIGQAPGAIGYYKLSSGALTLPAGGEVDPGGSAGGAGTFGQFDMVGGSVGGGDYLLPNRGAAGSSSVTNIAGGTFTIPSSVVDNGFNGLAVNWQNTGAAQTAAITIGSGGQFISPTVRVKLNEGSSFNGTTGNSDNVASLNLTGGGLIQTKGFLNGVGNNPNVSINFNNGTLKAGNAANAAFLSDLGSVNVYSGNATIDNNGQAISIAQPFLAASGTGVISVPVSAAGSGYITPPQVTFTGGTVSGGAGSAATGYATIDPATGRLTGIVVTNPGTYSDTTGLSVAINGGGGTGAALGAISTAANTSGGMTFSGAGETALTGLNTYTGATAVNGGTLRLTGSGEINSSSGITVNGSGAKLVQTSSAAITPVVTLTQGTLDGNGTINTVDVGNSAGNILTAGNGGFGTLVTGTLAFNGAATVNLGMTTSSIDTSISTTNLSTNAAGTVTLNVTNTGLWVAGTYPLITYSGAIGGAGFSKFALAPPSGLGGRQSATLTDTGSAVALNIGGDAPVWSGAVSGEWSTNVIAGSKNWNLQIGGGGTDFLANDLVLFDDSATGTTNVTINDGTVNPISTVFDNSTLNYTLSGTNGINTGTLTKSGSGSLVINNANNHAGATTLNAGTLHLNNASAIGTGTFVINGGSLDNTSGSPITLSTANPQNWNGNFVFAGSNDLNLGTGAVTMAATRTVTTNGNAALTVGGAVSGTGYGITKLGTGTLTLGGANNYTGDTTVTEGTLNLTGSAGLTGGLFVNGGGKLNLNGTFGTSTVNNTFVVGQAAGAGILNILPGVSLTRANLFLGDAFGVTGAVYQSGGTVTLTQGASVDNLRIGSAASGNGYYNMSGGSLTANEIGVGASMADTIGIMDVSAGTVTSNGWFVLGRGGSTSSGALNVTGGTVIFGSTTANPLSINWAGASGASSVVNVGGGAGAAAVIGASATAAGKGLNLAAANSVGTLGVVNLLTNGTLTVSEIIAGNANPTALLNFNGGTLAATAASRGVAFMPGTNVDGVFVYGGGGTIHNSGTNITIGSALLAPTIGSGNGVNGIASFTPGAGYIAAPLVQIVNDPGDTTGVGATAVATINPTTGELTGITITNPGVGYTATPEFVLTGGGATTAATVTGTAPTPNSSGGMTFSGAGRTTLTGANLYTGGTTVNGGTLQITDDAQLGAVPGSPQVNITLNGAALYNNDSNPVISANRTISLDAGGGYLQAGWAPKTLSVNGLITGTGGLGINWDGGSLFLNAANDYAGDTTIGVAGPSYWANAAANPTLKLGIDNALPSGAGKGNVTFGTSANNNTPTLDLNGHSAQINGLSGSANAVIDNLTGVGIYQLTVGNNDQGGTFGGAIRNTSGTVALTKTGGATLTLSGASSYTGDTTVNSGTLIANRPNNTLNPVTSAIGNNQVVRNVTVEDGATLQINSGDTLGGNSSTIATTLVINEGGTVTNGGGVFNRLGSVTLNGGTLTSVSGAIDGYQTYSLDAAAVITVGGSTVSTISTNGAFSGIHLNTNTFFNVADSVAGAGSDLTVSSPLINRNLSEGGAGGLTKIGVGTMTLAGANTYTGNTTVIEGTLSLSSAYLDDASTVTVETNGVLHLAHAGTDIVGTLVLNGVTHTSGLFDSTNSGGRITGGGKIQVGTLSGYALWASLNGATGQDPELDHDNDGVDNGVEYFMGQTGSTFTANPALDPSNNITWIMGDEYTGVYGTNYEVQTSSDLDTWAPVAEIDVTIDNTAPGKSVSYTLTGSGSRFVRLVVKP